MADQNPELVMQQVQSELANAYAQEFFTVSARETPPLSPGSRAITDSGEPNRPFPPSPRQP